MTSLRRSRGALGLLSVDVPPCPIILMLSIAMICRGLYEEAEASLQLAKRIQHPSRGCRNAEAGGG